MLIEKLFILFEFRNVAEEIWNKVRLNINEVWYVSATILTQDRASAIIFYLLVDSMSSTLNDSKDIIKLAESPC